MIGPLRSLRDNVAKWLRPQGSQVEQALVKAAVDEQAVAKAARPVMDRLVIGQGASLPFSPNAVVTMSSDVHKLLAFAKSGKLKTDEAASLAIGNISESVQRSKSHVAVVLTPEGKRKVGAHVSLEPLLDGWKSLAGNNRESLVFGKEQALRQTLELELGDISHILVPEWRHKGLVAMHQRAVVKQEAAEQIAGKPFTEFFRSSDDFFTDLEVEAFKNAVPGFAKRSSVEQRSVAALSSGIAQAFPSKVPEETRRRVATGLVSYKTVGDGTTSAKLTGELRQYYHGTGAGDKIAKKGFKVGDRGAYGEGVYYGNPAVAAGYAFHTSRHQGKDLPREIVTGQVDLGRVTAQDFFKQPAASTRYVRTPSEFGDYWVTKDPKRFSIQAVASYQPENAERIEKVIPDLLRAYHHDPDWALQYMDRVAPERLQGALTHSMEKGQLDERLAALMIKARKGDAQGLEVLMDLLKNGPSADARKQAGNSLIKSLSDLGEAGRKNDALVEALLTASEPSVRQRAGVQLVDLGDARGLPMALEALSNAPSPQERMQAGEVLLKVLDWKDSEQKAALSEALLASSEPALRMKATYKLLELGDTRDSLITNTLEALRKEPYEASQALFKTLSALGPERVKDREVIMEALLGTGRIDNLSRLASMGDKRAIAMTLESLVQDRVPGYRLREVMEDLLSASKVMGPERAQERKELLEALTQIEPRNRSWQDRIKNALNGQYS